MKEGKEVIDTSRRCDERRDRDRQRRLDLSKRAVQTERPDFVAIEGSSLTADRDLPTADCELPTADC